MRAERDRLRAGPDGGRADGRVDPVGTSGIEVDAELVEGTQDLGVAPEQACHEEREERDHDTEEHDEDGHRGEVTEPRDLLRSGRPGSIPGARQIPMRCASSSRWYVASPSRISELLARLK